MSIYADNPTDLAQLFVEVGVAVIYRRAFAASGAPTVDLTAGFPNLARPIGTRDAGYDTGEGAVLDSTVDAGTGFAGGYAPGIAVQCYFSGPQEPDMTALGRYGLALDEPTISVYLLAADIIPVRGDLLIHPNGERYLIGERILPLGAADAPIGYRAWLQHLTDHSHPAYSA